jgi:hypothetical protein
MSCARQQDYIRNSFDVQAGVSSSRSVTVTDTLAIDRQDRQLLAIRIGWCNARRLWPPQTLQAERACLKAEAMEIR